MTSSAHDEPEAKSFARKGVSVLIFGGLLFSAALWLLFVAAIVYGVVYHFYIPQSEIRSAVYFDVTKGETGRDYSLCVVGFGEVPLSSVGYSLNLALELQRSDRNKVAGNFPVTVSLVDDWSLNSTLSRSTSLEIIDLARKSDNVVRRTGILPFMSPLLESLHTLTFAPLFVFGLIKQTSFLNLELFQQVDFPSRKYKYAVILIKNQLDLEDASLIWRPQLRGIRYLMLKYPVISFFLGTFFVWFWELLVTFGTVLYVRGRSGDPEPQSSATNTHKAWEDIQIPRRSTSRRYYSSSPRAPESTWAPRQHQTWAKEFEITQSGDDTTVFSPRSETADADETPATIIEDFESPQQAGSHHLAGPASHTTGFSAQSKDTVKRRSDTG